VGTAVLGPDAFRRLSQARLEQSQENVIAAELLGSGVAQLTADQVRKVPSATLLVTGQRSPRLCHRFADRFEELLPHAQRVDIPASSHIRHEDNPGAYCAAVLSFLSGVRG
jgi:pimeloyl-ACP methyl ester carboxylesterase